MSKVNVSLHVLLWGIGGMVFAVYCARQDYCSLYWGPSVGTVAAVLGALACVRALGEGNDLLQRVIWTLGAAAVIVLCDVGVRGIEAHVQPSLRLLCMPVAALARWLGQDAVAGDGCIVLQNASGCFKFLPCFEFLGIRSLCALVFAAFWCEATLGIRGLASRVLIIGLVCCVLAWIVGMVGYANAARSYSGGSESNLLWFWSPAHLGTALGAVCLLSSSQRTVRTAALELCPVEAVIWGVFGGLFAGWGFAWDGVGHGKAGRVVVDERFGGEWEPARRLLDESRYGDFSTYSLSSAVESLSHRFGVRVNADSAYTDEFLADCDVLVFVTPQREIPEAEVRAIRHWVECGGGLFLVGDHTDLLGMNTRLNSLLDGTGLRFCNDSLQEGFEATFNYWSGPVVDAHPIEYGMGEIEFMTPCSVAVGWRARPLFQLRQALSAKGDYSRNSNFGGSCAGPDGAQGLLNAGGCCRFGAGRVATFGDSTIFSSFAYYRGAHQQVFERTVAWLNQESVGCVWLGVPLAVAFLGIIWASVVFVRRGRNGGLVASAFLVSTGIGIWSMDYVEGAMLSVPGRAAGSVGVGVIAGSAALPAVLGRQAVLGDGENLMTWVQIPQRLGYETRDVNSMPGVRGCDVLLLLNPGSGVLGILERGGFGEWLERGGRAVIVGKAKHRGHPEDAIPDLLNGIGLHEVVGFEELNVDVRHGRVGSGAVCVIYGSEELDTESIGHCMAIPNARQRALYELGYATFGRLIWLEALDRRTYLPRGK